MCALKSPMLQVLSNTCGKVFTEQKRGAAKESLATPPARRL